MNWIPNLASRFPMVIAGIWDFPPNEAPGDEGCNSGSQL